MYWLLEALTLPGSRRKIVVSQDTAFLMLKEHVPAEP